MIETERLLLIPVSLEILDSLIESDEAFLTNFGYINDGGEYLNPSPEYLPKIKQRLINHPEEYPLAVDYLIIIKDIKSVIGTIYFKSLPNEEGISEIGYGMNPKYEGCGYMSEALTAMLIYGKDSGIKKVVADALISNIKSQNVLTRCGFVLTEKQMDKLIFSKVLF